MSTPHSSHPLETDRELPPQPDSIKSSDQDRQDTQHEQKEVEGLHPLIGMYKGLAKIHGDIISPPASADEYFAGDGE